MIRIGIEKYLDEDWIDMISLCLGQYWNMYAIRLKQDSDRIVKLFSKNLKGNLECTS